MSDEATLYGGPLAGGIVSGAENALISGSKGWDVVKAGAIGGISAAIGSSIGSAIGGPVAAKLSSVIGSTASGVAATVVSSSVVGGVLGAGSAAFTSNGDPWQEFLNGMRSGAISGAISAAVPLAVNAMKKPAASVPREVDTRTVNENPPVKTELGDAPEINKARSLKFSKYTATAGDFYGRTVNDLPLASLDRGSFNGEVKVHGNSLKSTRPTWGYKLYADDGTFLKNGITSKLVPESRYTRAFMLDKKMVPFKQFPNRLAAWNWEFQQNQILRGSLNKNMH